MIRRITVAALQLGALAFFLAAFLFAGEAWRTSSGFLGSITRELEAIFQYSTTRWMVLLCLAFYFAAFLILEIRSSQSCKWEWGRNPILWQCAFLGLVLLGYTIGYPQLANSKAIQIVLGTSVFGKAISIWVGWQRTKRESRQIWTVCLLIFLLTGSVLWQQEATKPFQYNGVSRWSGVWGYPNLFGLLMGLSFVLSVGMAIRTWRAAFTPVCRGIGIFVCLVAALIVGFGLFKSLSRGAWFGTVIGLIYLVCVLLKNQTKCFSGRSAFWNRRIGMQILVIMFALTVLGFWQLRFLEWQPARRVFSAANVNDFSWRNRIVAWTGAIQMMSDRPLMGFGWGGAEVAYNEKYRPLQLENGAAIQMNDYFMIGISAGVPALVCFLMHVELSLRGVRRSKIEVGSLKVGDGIPAAEDSSLAWLQATCRAGTIVLLVGFFFDGGLFKLATGSVFWILLELGRGYVYRRDTETQRSDLSSDQVMSQVSVAPGRLARWGIWLRRGAWILGVVAVSESAVLLSTPFLGVTNTTLTISRHYLVPPSAVPDLNLLATNVDWSSRKLRPLLQHSSLANYNRQLINWKLDDQIYREFVLNPLIDPRRDGQLAWRRKLWEYFYLPMRKENDPASAVPIVLKFLHQRVATVPDGPVTIDEMWEQKRADDGGIQALEVAAFRSVGIPARLNDGGRAELFSNGKWQAAPEDTQTAPLSTQGR